MCRIFGYIGPPVGLDTLLSAPPHSLTQQASAPRLQDPGRLNADGWGVAWYDATITDEPARYRTSTPMWADNRFRDIGRFIRSGHVVAAVRHASPGSPIEETGNSPFIAGPYSFTHNGYVDGFRNGLGVSLRRGLSERRDGEIRGASDSEVVFAMVLDQLDKGASMADALASALEELPARGKGKFNFILSDGHTMLATREGNSLFTLGRLDARFVASEPFDDGVGWVEVPDHSLVTMTGDALRVEPLT